MVKKMNEYVENGLFLFVFLYFLVIIVCAGLAIKNQHERLTDVECSLGMRDDCMTPPDIEAPPIDIILQGWTEECIEYEVIHTERYLVAVGDRGVIGMEFSYNKDNWESPLYINNNRTKFMEHWNETRCTKKILVYQLEDM